MKAVLFGAHCFPKKGKKSALHGSVTSSYFFLENAWSFLYLSKLCVRRHIVTEKVEAGDWLKQDSAGRACHTWSHVRIQ